MENCKICDREISEIEKTLCCPINENYNPDCCLVQLKEFQSKAIETFQILATDDNMMGIDLNEPTITDTTTQTDFKEETTQSRLSKLIDLFKFNR